MSAEAAVAAALAGPTFAALPMRAAGRTGQRHDRAGLGQLSIDLLLLLARAGILLWMTFKRPAKAPDFFGSRAHLHATPAMTAAGAQSHSRRSAPADETQPGRFSAQGTGAPAPISSAREGTR